MSLQRWWKAWGDLVLRLLALVASFASIAGLSLPFLPPPANLPWWAVALFVSAAFFLGVLVVLEFRSQRGRRVYAKSDTEGIKRYMDHWIKHGGRVAIWTRDMSWAQSPKITSLLTNKANNHELILCLPKPNELARQLENAGAEVCAYGEDYLESPASRFTIAFFGRDGASVAVGRADGNVHVIDEFSSGGHPAFHLADDLVRLVRALQRRASRCE